MKFLIVHQDPFDFAADLYARDEDLASRPYELQIIARDESLFGVGNSCSNSLRRLGHEAMDLYPTLTPLQQAWAREHKLSYDNRDQIMRFRRRFGIIPWPYYQENQNWIPEILEAQIKAYRPDVIYSFGLQFLDSKVLRATKGSYRIAVGHQLSGFPGGDSSAYDLMLTVQDDQTEYWRSRGVRSELLHLAFDSRVEKYMETRPKKYDISFVGDLAEPRTSAMRLLDSLCRKYPVSIWGRGADKHPEGSPIRRACRGVVWGVDRYQVMRDSKIVLCSRSELSREEAYETLLFQSTGIGALTIADADICPDGLYSLGKDLLAYRSAEQCRVLADYYLHRDSEREAVAKAGQRRTLYQHNYYSRMQELVDICIRLQMGYEPVKTTWALAGK